MSKCDHAESAASWERIEMPGASVEERPRPSGRERVGSGELATNPGVLKLEVETGRDES